MSKNSPVCLACGTELHDDNWHLYDENKHYYICKPCKNVKRREWKKAHPDKYPVYEERFRRSIGHRPIDEDRYSALYLGVYIAEHVLFEVFQNVVRMPPNNRGYDFICSRDKKVDVKASCLHIQSGRRNKWAFKICKNTIADAFMCVAFDNRENLNPLHIWLIPGYVINDKVNVGISTTTVDKWSKYELPIDKVISCCNAMKEST